MEARDHRRYRRRRPTRPTRNRSWATENVGNALVFAATFPSVVVGRLPPVRPPPSAPSSRALALPPPLILLPVASDPVLCVHRVPAARAPRTPRTAGRRPTSSSSKPRRARRRSPSSTASRPAQAASARGYPFLGPSLTGGLGRRECVPPSHVHAPAGIMELDYLRGSGGGHLPGHAQVDFLLGIRFGVSILYILHPIHPTSYILHPTSYILHPPRPSWAVGDRCSAALAAIDLAAAALAAAAGQAVAAAAAARHRRHRSWSSPSPTPTPTPSLQPSPPPAARRRCAPEPRGPVRWCAVGASGRGRVGCGDVAARCRARCRRRSTRAARAQHARSTRAARAQHARSTRASRAPLARLAARG